MWHWPTYEQTIWKTFGADAQVRNINKNFNADVQQRATFNAIAIRSRMVVRFGLMGYDNNVWGYRQHNVNVEMQWIKGKWGVEESTINHLNKRLAFIYNLCVWVDPTTIKDKRTRVIAHGKLDVVPSPKFSWATASSSGSTSNYVGSRHLWRLKWRFVADRS